MADTTEFLDQEDAGKVAVRETAGLNGGYPVVGDTRIAVRLVVEAQRETGDLARTVEAFPHLTPEQVHAALDYYQKNPARVDEDIEQNARALRELQSR